MPVATGSAMAFLRWLESAGNAQELRVEAGQHLFNQPTTPKPSRQPAAPRRRRHRAVGVLR